MKKLLARAMFLLCFFIALACSGYLYLESWAHKPVLIQGEQVLEFKAGTSLGTLASELAKRGLITNPLLFRIWIKITGEYPHFQAGNYRLVDQATPHDISIAMIRGDTWNPVVLSITIPEGFTLKETIPRLAKHGVGESHALAKLAKSKSFLTSLNIKSPTLEGYVYPATYAFYKFPTAEEAFTKMVENFWKNLPKDYEQNVGKMGLSLAEAVTFASLIELETRVDDERPLVSEVIWRRLKDKAPLGIDASIIYGVADYNGNLTRAHLNDSKNPYNTRIHFGLPPTPIGSPSRKSLEAVLTPSSFGYYYYVLRPGDIRHHFSKTLNEHNHHVRILVEGLKLTKPAQGEHHAK